MEIANLKAYSGYAKAIRVSFAQVLNAFGTLMNFMDDDNYFKGCPDGYLVWSRPLIIGRCLKAEMRFWGKFQKRVRPNLRI